MYILKIFSLLFLKLVGFIPNWAPFDRFICLFLAIFRNRSILFLFKKNSFNGRLVRQMLRGHLTSPLVRRTTHKLHYKNFIENVLGQDVCPKTYYKDICDLNGLPYPGPCVIKTCLGSGDSIIVKNNADWKKVVLQTFLKTNYARTSRQENYVGLNSLIVEELVFPNNLAMDFKLFVVQGKVRLIQVDVDRHNNHVRHLYLPNWTKCKFGLHYPPADGSVSRPPCLNNMLEAAGKIGSFFEMVRVDFYASEEQYFIGEITHFHGGGGELVSPNSNQNDFDRLLFCS